MKINHREVTRHSPGPSRLAYRWTLGDQGVESFTLVRAQPRFTVEGIDHPKGSPIRFKSLERAVNHVANIDRMPRASVVVEK